MAELTPTQALANAPASTRKTTFITACDAILTEIDGAVSDNASGNSQAWTVVVGGTPTGGTYTITLTDAVNGARTTSALAHNASGAAVQAALRLLSGTGLANTTVAQTGTTPNFTNTIQFKGTRAAITVTVTSSLTGGSPTLVPTQTSAFVMPARMVQAAANVLKTRFIDWVEEVATNLRW